MTVFILVKLFSSHCLSPNSPRKWSGNITYTFYGLGRRLRFMVKLLRILWLRRSRPEFLTLIFWWMYFKKKKMEGKSSFCLTGITTHGFLPWVYMCVCAIRFPTITEKETKLLCEARAIIKTIKFKISKKILNRLQIA